MRTELFNLKWGTVGTGWLHKLNLDVGKLGLVNQSLKKGVYLYIYIYFKHVVTHFGHLRSELFSYKWGTGGYRAIK